MRQEVYSHGVNWRRTYYQRISLPGRNISNLLTQGLRFIPGSPFLLSSVVLGKVAAQYVPHMEYVIFAIAFGALISNAVSLPKVFIPGVRTYEFWLKVGIVLMGPNLPCPVSSILAPASSWY